MNQALARMKRSGRWLGREIKVSSNTVNLWSRGLSRPEHHYRIALQNLLGVDPLLWMTAAERTIAGLPPIEPAPAQAAA